MTQLIRKVVYYSYGNLVVGESVVDKNVHNSGENSQNGIKHLLKSLIIRMSLHIFYKYSFWGELSE